MSLSENHFEKFRNNIIGINQTFSSPFGTQKIVYADWVASGRLYKPIEEKIANQIGPFVANTHTETSETGTLLTEAYHQARNIIKQHVNAGKDDVLLFSGFGMTAAINKFQRILGLTAPEQLREQIHFKEEDVPLVIITHMEHHSNQTSWLETFAEVVILEPDNTGQVDLSNLEKVLNTYKNRKLKIGSFTAASNVTGIQPPIHEMAKIMHKHDGLCFVDFAMAGPYVPINMHPKDSDEKLDAIFFSPHKFLGGPGSSGVLIFDKALYKRKVPDHPGGGTVDWTNPWGEHKYSDNIEIREDGGTPGFLEAIKGALSVKLKEEMSIKLILEREHELLDIAIPRLKKIEGIHLLAPQAKNRLAVLSFYSENVHYNLFVKLLSDKYGIQTRGGCSCAGTYGHYLLHIDPTRSHDIAKEINHGDLSHKPGWVRLSLHPTMTDNELNYILDAVEEINKNYELYLPEYDYLPSINEFRHKSGMNNKELVKEWFNF